LVVEDDAELRSPHDWDFATPEVMDLLEEKRCGYIFGLSTNPRLTEIGRPARTQGRRAKRSIWRTATFETIRCTFL
jgi:hypothetical protein